MSESILWNIALSVIVIGWMAYSVIKTGVDDTKFRAKGVKAEARIINKKNIGVSGTGNMRFKMELEFETENGTTRARARRFFTPEELMKIMRKNTVLLYYLPENPKKVFLVPGDME